MVVVVIVVVLNVTLWHLLSDLAAFTLRHLNQTYSVIIVLAAEGLLHCMLSLAVQCIVIGPVCVFAMGGRTGVVCVWVCYHDNSKLHALI